MMTSLWYLQFIWLQVFNLLYQPRRHVQLSRLCCDKRFPTHCTYHKAVQSSHRILRVAIVCVWPFWFQVAPIVQTFCWLLSLAFYLFLESWFWFPTSCFTNHLVLVVLGAGTNFRRCISKSGSRFKLDWLGINGLSELCGNTKILFSLCTLCLGIKFRMLWSSIHVQDFCVFLWKSLFGFFLRYKLVCVGQRFLSSHRCCCWNE